MVEPKGLIFNQGLIRTKCNQPGISRHLVWRWRLSEKLSGALDHKLTIVTAPTGYGKSTAVIDWLGQAGLPLSPGCRWMSVITPGEAFWRYISLRWTAS
jgi:LuxR family maltose regulon positive regulatory protein